MSDIINFVQGIFQGDSLSDLLFILSVNPVSFLLHKLQGYACGKYKNYNVTHNFFVDDLKLYATSTKRKTSSMHKRSRDKSVANKTYEGGT